MSKGLGAFEQITLAPEARGKYTLHAGNAASVDLKGVIMDHVNYVDQTMQIFARPFTLSGHPFVVTACSDPGAFGFTDLVVVVSCAQGLGQIQFLAPPSFMDQLTAVQLPDQVLNAADQLYNA